MTAKKWTICTLVVTLSVLILFALFMFITDPLLVFRKETSIFSYWKYNKLYSNPGIARQYTYDTVLTGSSMIGEFDTTQIDAAFGATTVKLGWNNANAYNYKQILDICFAAQPDLKRVIISLDTFAFVSDYDTPGDPLPEYLYQLEPSSYPKYLLSLDTVYHQVAFNIYYTAKGVSSLAMPAKPAGGEYGVEETMRSYRDKNETVEQVDTGAYQTNAQDNLNYNLLPLIAAHPETEFDLFLPPYSILYGKNKLENGEFDALMQVQKTVIGQCLAYDNVRVFAFAWDPEFFLDLEQYRDAGHYSPAVCTQMVERMRDGKNELTLENYQQGSEQYCTYIREFDYETFLNEQLAKLIDEGKN